MQGKVLLNALFHCPSSWMQLIMYGQNSMSSCSITLQKQGLTAGSPKWWQRIVPGLRSSQGPTATNGGSEAGIGHQMRGRASRVMDLPVPSLAKQPRPKWLKKIFTSAGPSQNQDPDPLHRVTVPRQPLRSICPDHMYGVAQVWRNSPRCALQ